MIKNRVFKWVTAGTLALGCLPAIGMARPRASLPSAVSVTPVSMDAPVAVRHAIKAKHKSAAKNRKAAVRKHAAKRHRQVRAKAKHTTPHGRSRKTHAKKSATHKSKRSA